ncbi:MAG: excinuclease ABC subunit UvrA, partial [Bacillota bacterium]
MKNQIRIKGAREHNLKNIDLEIPRDKLVVITGLSGSGKSSLAYDTIYAEGQRRYVESLSAYARQFLGQMDKPDVDYIEGLSPAISIDQKTTARNPRSTVGTVTEIYDYLRLLYARVGRAHCPKCGQPITKQTVSQIVDQLMVLPERSRLQILAPLIRGRKGEHQKILEDLKLDGFVRVRVNGAIKELTEEIKLAKTKKHSIEAVIDRVILKEGIESRLADSLETALKLGEGLVIVLTDEQELLFSEHFSCVDCGINLEEINPRTFSFNSPFGACPVCTGLGFKMEMDPDLVIPNKSLSINEGAIAPWGKMTGNYYPQILKAVADYAGFSLDTPIEELDESEVQLLLYGSGKEKIKFRYRDLRGRNRLFDVPYEGVIPNLERRYRESQSDWARDDTEQYMSRNHCPACQGGRLRPEALAVTIGGINIDSLTRLSVEKALEFFNELQLTDRENLIAYQILKEIKSRLGFLVNVGLDYLTLARAAGSLSGGEAQRIRLATQIGSSLMGVLYILDEPSIGLHQRDNARLIKTLKELRDLGNTLIVVEHDEETMYAADHIVDIGPGAGKLGGEVVASGTIQDIIREPGSVTGQYLSGKKQIPVPPLRRSGNGKWLSIKGAKVNNLKSISVEIPLGLFVCVTGVSGSGKSSLINEVLYKRLAQQLHRAKAKPGEHLGIEGVECLEKVIEIDQSPIGRTPRSNPATYTGVFDDIRATFAATQDSKV